MNFWKNMLSYYSINYLNLAQLFKIIFAVGGGTGPIERSYSMLAKPCYKDKHCRSYGDTIFVTNSLQNIWRDFLRSMNLITKNLICIWNFEFFLVISKF